MNVPKLEMCSAVPSLLPTAMTYPRRDYTHLDTLVVVLFIVCLHCFLLTSTSAAFVTDPKNKNVYEGSKAVFTCMTELENSQTIKWFADSTMITTNSRLFTGEDSTSSSNYRYAWLQISHVELSDTGKQFFCAVFEDGKNKVAESQRAVLNVTRVPQSTSPDCRRLDVSYNEGDRVEAICAQEITNPRVRLAIYKGNTLLNDSSKRDSKMQSTFIATFVARRSDDGVIIWCSQTPPTDDYPQQFRRNCSFGNMNVNYVPSISINGATKITLDQQRKQQEVVYVCTGVAKPSSITYEWIVKFDHDPTVKYSKQHNGNTLRLVFGPSTIVREVNLTCIGSNSVGRSTVKQTLRVIHNSTPTVSPEPLTVVTGHEFTWSTALILAVTGSCGLCIALFTAVIIGFYHFQLPQSLDIYGERIAQPVVYFEPKDGISSPQVLDGKHSVGVQVSEEADIESVYTEVSEYGIKKEKDKTPENNSYSHV